MPNIMFELSMSKIKIHFQGKPFTKVILHALQGLFLSWKAAICFYHVFDRFIAKITLRYFLKGLIIKKQPWHTNFLCVLWDFILWCLNFVSNITCHIQMTWPFHEYLWCMISNYFLVKDFKDIFRCWKVFFLHELQKYDFSNESFHKWYIILNQLFLKSFHFHNCKKRLCYKTSLWGAWKIR